MGHLPLVGQSSGSHPKPSTLNPELNPKPWGTFLSLGNAVGRGLAVHSSGIRICPVLDEGLDHLSGVVFGV